MDDNYENDSPLSSLSGSPEKNIRNRTFEYLNRSGILSPTNRYLRYIGFGNDFNETGKVSIESKDDSYLMEVYPFEIENSQREIHFLNDIDDQSESLIEENSVNSLSTIFFENMFLYLNERRYIFTYSFLLLNLVFFTYGLFKNGGNFLKISPDEDILFYDGISNWPNCRDQRFELWRFITSTLVHADIGHLIINLIILLPYSFSIETFQKSKNLLFVYILTTIHSSIIFFIQNPYVSVIGCSNIVFSFIGAHLSNTILNYDYLSIEHFNSFIMLILTIIVILFEILNYINNRSDNVAYIGHWVGFFSGFLGGLSLFNIFIKNRYKIIIQICSRILYLSLTIILIYYYISDYPPTISYDEFFNKKETFDCCYELFIYNKKQNSSDNNINNFDCPYLIDYTKVVNIYK